MKNTIYFFAFIICFWFMWTLMSFFGLMITDYSFKECFQSGYHSYGVVFLYWYCPYAFVHEDLNKIL